MAFGRPSKYRDTYCDLLIAHMSQGLSFESFASTAQVNRDTLYSWCQHHADFSDAKKRGEAVSLLFWERLGIDASQGRLPGFSAAAWIFNMKNRFGWRDKQRDEELPKVNEKPHLELSPDRQIELIKVLERYIADLDKQEQQGAALTDPLSLPLPDRG